ncbi:TROVE domain protein [Pirellula staleyi DSM 6068]|uniref:TROVE domain protein n=1 Tax=Pirellula staleyi (strain ATCC 27377 / DSM 6068 / ICPB 4128) TaxID=530564 RepID=D2R2E3_PIRSD|nr:TROVE domain-containing protein [Pirellula staleyi]ADB15052.1 TROVE domain protein [Pirellula staleyi DSM 6068]
MASKSLFQSIVGKFFAAADVLNRAGGLAYSRTAEQALAQYVATGMLGSTCYANAETHLATVLRLAQKVSPEFIARAAIYSRDRAYLKDVPALLVALLTVKSPELVTSELFQRVIDSPKMLRNFVQIIRSGVVGRKSLGSRPKRLVREWLDARSDQALFVGSVGNDPSLGDIVKMVHPVPRTPSREALYAWLIGREYEEGALPPIVQEYERIKRQVIRGKDELPDVPFSMLTHLPLTPSDWKRIARNASWQTTRMNLNTFERHGVLQDQELVRCIANRLRNPRAIQQARVFPYQLMAAYLNMNETLPAKIKAALGEAMELAISNVPRIEGKVLVMVDVSGSMRSPATGNRGSATSKVRCIDVAALIAASIVRKNPEAEVIPFSDDVILVKLDRQQPVMKQAQQLASLPSVGTNCSAALAHANARQLKASMVIYVSDNESWIDSQSQWKGHRATETMRQWQLFQKRNPQAKLVCLDLVPGETTQAIERSEIFHIGGFSDHVFTLLAEIAEGRTATDYFVKQIDAIELQSSEKA